MRARFATLPFLSAGAWPCVPAIGELPCAGAGSAGDFTVELGGCG